MALRGFLILKNIYIMEIWKDCLGYEGLYEVSNLGNVKSLFFRNERILKPCVDTYGYLKVVLYLNRKTKTIKVHQLVAIAFLNHKPCGMKLVINHKNFDKTDNRIENLEIITQRENANRKHLSSTSKYVGVNWSKKSNKWMSYITINAKINHLGYFETELEASNAYEKALYNLKTQTFCTNLFN